MLNITRIIIALLLMGTPSQTFAHASSAPGLGTTFPTINQPGSFENVQESGSFQVPTSALSSEFQAPCSNDRTGHEKTTSPPREHTAGYAYDGWTNQGNIADISGHSTQVKYDATTLKDITEYPGHARKALAHNLNPKTKEINRAEVTIAYAYDALKKLSGAVAPKRGAIKKTINKNSRSYQGESHVYVIRAPDGSINKVGKSSTGVRVKDGASKRAEAQVRRLNRDDIKNGGVGGFESEIRKTLNSSGNALDYEKALRDRYRELYGKDMLPGNLEHLRGRRKK